MIFRQLFDPETSTYSYLLADEITHEAVLIDSVREQLERDTTLKTIAFRFTFNQKMQVQALEVETRCKRFV